MESKNMIYFKSLDGLRFGKILDTSLKSDCVEISKEEYNNLIKIKEPPVKEKHVKPELRIIQLKQLLSDTDYQAIKYAEGVLTEEEYADMKAQRIAWRKEINELEGNDA